MNKPSQLVSTAPRSRQAGFSLIELMIAVTIGLFITLGLSEMFLSMYTTSATQRSFAQFQDNQRFAINILSNNLSLIGYYWDPNSTTITNALVATTTSNPDGSAFAAGTGLVGTSPTTGSDTINVYYQSGGSAADGLINCQGQTAPTAATPVTFINSFSIDANSNLVCAVRVGTGTTGSPLIVANNVQSMKILYGLIFTPASPTTLPPYVGSYMTATQINAASVSSGVSQWGNISSIQITLVFLNPVTNTTATRIQTFNVMYKL